MWYIYLGWDSPNMSRAPEKKESVSREGNALGLILFVMSIRIDERMKATSKNKTKTILWLVRNSVMCSPFNRDDGSWRELP
jgi:hypothetical protein